MVEISRLRAFDLFVGLDEAQLADISQHFVETTVETDTVLIQQGQVGKDVYLLEEGTACVYRGEADAAGLLADIQAPTIFGETAMLDPERIRTASVKALTRLRLLTIQISALFSILQRFPLVKANFRKIVAARR